MAQTGLFYLILPDSDCITNLQQTKSEKTFKQLKTSNSQPGQKKRP